MAASPTLLGIPAELRQKIIRALFDNGATEPDYEPYLDLHDSEECQSYIQHWNLDHSVLSMSEFAADVAAVVSLTLNVGDHYFNNYADPENHKPEDFITNLSVGVRRIVTSVVFTCPWSYRGNQFNRTTFPQLKTVIIDGLVKIHSMGCEITYPGCTRPILDQYIHYDVDSDVEWEELTAGNHDYALAAIGNEMADRETMRDPGTLHERGFHIFCKCLANIYRRRDGVKKIFKMVCGAFVCSSKTLD